MYYLQCMQELIKWTAWLSESVSMREEMSMEMSQANMDGERPKDGLTPELLTSVENYIDRKTSEAWARLGGEIMLARKRKKLTQAEAAAQAGISIGAWQNLESGAQQSPRESTIDAVKGVLEWPDGKVSDILCDDPEIQNDLEEIRAASPIMRLHPDRGSETEKRIDALESKLLLLESAVANVLTELQRLR